MINNIMKTKLILALIFLSVMRLEGQSQFGQDEVTCKQNLSVFREYYKQKNYADALIPWRWVYFNCPASSGNIYKNGPKIIKDRIKKDPENKDSYVDTIMMIFDQRIQYGFGQESYILGLKGYELVMLDKKRSLEAFEILKKAIDMSGNNSHFSAVYGYMEAVVNLEESGQKTPSDVLDVYATVAQIVDYNITNESKATKYFIQYSEEIEDLFTPYANCDDLNSLFSNQLDSRRDDVNFLERVANTLKDQNCKESNLFLEVTTALYDLKPSASSAYLMAKKSILNKNNTDGIRYAKEAIDMEENPDLKAKYYLALADAYRSSGSFSSARGAVYNALKYKNGWGEAYLSLGNIYVAGAKSCGSDFEKQTVYWVAIDAFRQALNDSQTKNRASRSINTYSKYFPNTEDCFFNGLSEGDTYKVSCWINKSTTVRTSD